MHPQCHERPKIQSTELKSVKKPGRFVTPKNREVSAVVGLQSARHRWISGDCSRAKFGCSSGGNTAGQPSDDGCYVTGVTGSVTRVDLQPNIPIFFAAPLFQQLPQIRHAEFGGGFVARFKYVGEQRTFRIL